MNLGDILDHVASFEQRLDSYLQLARDKSTNNKARLVSYCLALHRRHMDCVMHGLKPELLQDARKTKLKRSAALAPDKHLHLPKSPPEEISGEELIEAAISYNSELASIYRAILANPVDKNVCTVLKACVMVKERDIAMLEKMLGMKYF